MEFPIAIPALPVANRATTDASDASDDDDDDDEGGGNPCTETVFSCPSKVAQHKPVFKFQILAVPSQLPLTKKKSFPLVHSRKDKLVTGLS